LQKRSRRVPFFGKNRRAYNCIGPAAPEFTRPAKPRSDRTVPLREMRRRSLEAPLLRRRGSFRRRFSCRRAGPCLVASAPGSIKSPPRDRCWKGCFERVAYTESSILAQSSIDRNGPWDARRRARYVLGSAAPRWQRPGLRIGGAELAAGSGSVGGARRERFDHARSVGVPLCRGALDET
jgi:hypothetical protein